MEGERKWEDLNIDCLVKVFEGVGLESLMLDVPFVCKSWHKGSQDPKCWKVLDFSILNDSRGNYFWLHSFTESFIMRYGIRSFSNLKFIKLVVSRSNRSATSLTLPKKWTVDILEYILEECPALKCLGFGSFPGKYMYGISDLQFRKLNDLEELKLGDYRGYCLTEILAQISDHGHSFYSLSLSGFLGNKDASAIATLTPQIKRLNLTGSKFGSGSLKLILEGCKDLEYLNISFCFGDDCNDFEVLTMASHVKTFLSLCSGFIIIIKI